MSTPLHAFLLYKFGVIAIGAFVVYLGYRLLLRGAFDTNSDLKLRWGERELTLSRAAPGSLFALFGAGVMVAALALSRFEQTTHAPGQAHATVDGHEQEPGSYPTHIIATTPAPAPAAVQALQPNLYNVPPDQDSADNREPADQPPADNRSGGTNQD